MKYLYSLIIMIAIGGNAQAQLPNGTVVHNFTFTDLNGVSQNLYSYLNQGKHVAFEVSATWCHPCWDYHTSGTMDSLYQKHDAPGDNTWKVFFIEGDNATSVDQLNGIGTTQGNWVAGTQFPIMNPSGVVLNDFLSYYNVTGYPTLFMICPDRKVYADTLNKGTKPTVATWEYAASQCAPVGVSTIKSNDHFAVYPNPATTYTDLSFDMASAGAIAAHLSDVTGRIVADKNFGVIPAGNANLRFPLNDVQPGIYFFSITINGASCKQTKIVVQ